MKLPQQITFCEHPNPRPSPLLPSNENTFTFVVAIFLESRIFTEWFDGFSIVISPTYTFSQFLIMRRLERVAYAFFKSVSEIPVAFLSSAAICSSEYLRVPSSLNTFARYFLAESAA